MPNAECTAIGIPDKLHKDEREDDPVFNVDEVLFRRFKVQGEPAEWLTNSALSAAVFEIKNDSFNRSKYSDAEDVLYNDRPEDNGAHYVDWGILSLPVSCINLEIPIDHKEKGVVTRRIFTIQVRHTSKPCNYAHCEIFVFEDGVQIDSNKPKSVKLSIRNHLVGISTILKKPS